VVFKLSGRMDAENIDELEAVIARGKRSGFAHRPGLERPHASGIKTSSVFLYAAEADSIKLKNCPAYIPRVDDKRTGK